MWVEPVTLEGARVRMEPLSLERHWDGLLAIALVPEIWRFMINDVHDAASLRAYLDTAALELAEARSLPFATIDLASGRVAGCTRFGSIDERHCRVEIGWTWVGREFQRTHVNTEAKYLMLRHAFETLGCERVEFRAHALNERSRNAMERIGAKFEGTLRRHMVRETGEWRDTVYYSILADEWPAVKARLEQQLLRC
jgi:RimJ/RimL family protein N-acetyltransferase